MYGVDRKTSLLMILVPYVDVGLMSENVTVFDVSSIVGKGLEECSQKMNIDEYSPENGLLQRIRQIL